MKSLKLVYLAVALLVAGCGGNQSAFVGEWTGRYVEVDATIAEKAASIEAETGMAVPVGSFDSIKTLAAIMEFGLVLNSNGSGVFIDGNGNAIPCRWSPVDSGAVVNTHEEKPSSIVLGSVDSDTIRGIQNDGSRFLFKRK